MKDFNEVLKAEREEIDLVDRTMADLFERRMHAVVRVAEKKIEAGLPVFDPSREAAMKERNLGYLSDPDLAESYLEFLEAMLVVSKKYQEKIIASKNDD